MTDIAAVVNASMATGKPVALATVIETWGSSPRQVGAQMAITPGPEMAGSVSGGCVESAVIEEALEIIAEEGPPRLLTYGISDDTAWDVGLACGGTLRVFVQRMLPEYWQIASGLLANNQPFKVVTLLSGEMAGAKVLLAKSTMYISPALYHQPALLNQLQTVSRSAEHTGVITLEDHRLFQEISTPPPRLIVIGGAHVALALQHFARALGFRLIIVDPRRAFATPERFPLAEQIIHDYPESALAALQLDSESYVVVLSHDPKIDDPALKTALRSAAAYTGVMSSRHTHEKRRERLLAAGLTPEQLARIHTPIGLDIGATTPEEIALAIMAEIIAARRG